MTANETMTCVGVDVGGTFTDAVLTVGGSTWRAKAPTTPGRVGEGVLAAARLAAERSGRTLEELLPTVRRFGLGTTVVTNALASRTGRKVGLVTTRGFEELLPLARGARLVDDDGWLQPPAEILPRRLIAGATERIDRNGDIVVPLDIGEVRAAGRRLIEDEGVEAIAVSFLWAFVNPTHEEEAVRLLKQDHPEAVVVSGSSLYPAIREYERTSFAVLNAYVSGAFAGIEQLEADLVDLGMTVPLLLVHSAGGSITVAEARRLPLGLAESGPAAGVAASVKVAEAVGLDDVVTCDMGGTSFDVSVISSGAPARRTRGELMGVWTALSLIDVESIGAGGGSIGWIDARGMLRVGPRSAGAVPGPACYGRGGQDATVTDALVVLGYLDPKRFLGGEMLLDTDAARRVCARLGKSLGLGAEEAAWGIRQIALAGMVKAVRSRLADRGLDPRTNSLLSYGGSGSLFTPDIARAIGSPTVVVPELAAVLSAFGAATTDVRRERLRSVLAPMPVDPLLIRKLMDELRDEVESDLLADGIPAEDQSVAYEADLRFSRQIWEIQIPIGDGDVDIASLESLLNDFREEYAKRYGQGSIVLAAPIELVSLRVVGTGRTAQATLHPGSRETVAAVTKAPRSTVRNVRLERGPDGDRPVDVYDAADLRAGHVVDGPALLDGSDTTIWVPPGASGRVDDLGTFLMEVAE
ncbi:MAG TPA: hydantoinase/oxoprolinase family protein [Acidimicrobiales bacterium]|nr:hydantoinase/oxoprolinase family protein [Acidimicrobiales bacterium]